MKRTWDDYRGTRCAWQPPLVPVAVRQPETSLLASPVHRRVGRHVTTRVTRPPEEAR